MRRTVVVESTEYHNNDTFLEEKKITIWYEIFLLPSMITLGVAGNIICISADILVEDAFKAQKENSL